MTGTPVPAPWWSREWVLGAAAAEPAGDQATAQADTQVHLATPGRRLEVRLHHNQATVQAYEDGQLVRSSYAFAGLPEEPTPEGEFQVQALLGTLRTTIWAARSNHEWDLPYFIQFADDYGFHGPMIDPRTGQPSLTFTAGCLALSFEDARWLYEWVTPGTPIRIIGDEP